MADLLRAGAPDDGFLAEIDRRWAGTTGPERAAGVTGDVVLLHIATMTNLFAALGWTLALVLLHPEAHERVAAGDDALLERCVQEAIRIGQRSIMMRTVLAACEVRAGATYLPARSRSRARHHGAADQHERGAGTRCVRPRPLGGTPAARRSRASGAELVTTFGHGPHRCPAQRFSLSAIRRAVHRLVDGYELTPAFDRVRPLPLQIGGVARAADPCPVAYRARVRR